jgi:PKD repeat protein
MQENLKKYIANKKRSRKITISAAFVFSFTPSTDSAPLPIQIIDESQGAKSYSYNFGDGTAAVTEATPSHTYTTPGTFTIAQTVTNTHGSITATKQITIQHLPIANFTCDFMGGEVPLTVTFTDRSQYASGGITWDFGDGSPTENKFDRDAYI